MLLLKVEIVNTRIKERFSIYTSPFRDVVLRLYRNVRILPPRGVWYSSEPERGWILVVALLGVPQRW